MRQDLGSIEKDCASRGGGELEKRIDEIREFERFFLPQLEELGSRMEVVYGRYADMARKMMNATLRVARFSAFTNLKLALGVEIAARAIESAGAVVTASRHNEQLKKWLEVKMQIAARRRGAVEMVLPRVQANGERLRQLAEKYLRKDYALDRDADMSAVAELTVKVLSLYRTNLYLQRLGEYLIEEYGAWCAGNQTSGAPLPTYFSVNREIELDLFQGSYKETFSRAASAFRRLSGEDVAALSDPQIAAMALEDYGYVVEVDTAEACDAVASMLKSNDAVEEHNRMAAEYRDRIKDPTLPLKLMTAAMLVLVAVASVFWLDAGVAGKTVFALGFSGMIVSVGVRVWRSMVTAHVKTVDEWLGRERIRLLRMAGYVEIEEVDYTPKNVYKEGLRKLVNQD